MPLLDSARRALPATVFTLAVAAAIAPIAYWQHGKAGLAVVAVGAVAVVLSFAMANWSPRVLSAAGRATAGVLAATGLRMVLPLALALVLAFGQLVPARTVIYLVPLYLSMLGADTFLAARRPHETGGRASVGHG